VAVRSLAVIVVGLALGIGVAVVAIAVSGSGDEAKETALAPATSTPLRSRAARDGNRRVLTGEQTRRLVRYATALHACLLNRGVEVTAPAKDLRAITIEADKAVGLERLVVLATACADRLGEPPRPSSLQAVDARTIVLSVPKQCLLDPKVELPPVAR
jgi:hypothetical protein